MGKKFKVNYDREVIVERLSNIEYDFGKSVNQILFDLSLFKEKYKDYFELYFDTEFVGYDGAIDYYLTGKRLEDDSTYQERISLEEAELQKRKDQAIKAQAAKEYKDLLEKQSVEKAEREMYEKLKIKFGV